MLKPKHYSRIVTGIILVPYFWNIWRAYSGNLGAEPIQELLESTGLWGWRLLLINLFIGSAIAVFSLRPKVRASLILMRRPMGIVSFSYLFFHLGLFVLNEAGWEPAFAEIQERLYLSVAFGAWLILLLLTLTSNNIAVRKIGRRWKTLHRLVYLATGLAIVHVVLNEKSDALWHSIETVPILLLWMLRLAKFSWGKFHRRA